MCCVIFNIAAHKSIAVIKSKTWNALYFTKFFAKELYLLS
jgi:hypothetical protein